MNEMRMLARRRQWWHPPQSALFCLAVAVSITGNPAFGQQVFAGAFNSFFLCDHNVLAWVTPRRMARR